MIKILFSLHVGISFEHKINVWIFLLCYEVTLMSPLLHQVNFIEPQTSSEFIKFPQKSHIKNITVANSSKTTLNRSKVRLESFFPKESCYVTNGILVLRRFLPTTECPFDFLRDSDRQMITVGENLLSLTLLVGISLLVDMYHTEL